MNVETNKNSISVPIETRSEAGISDDLDPLVDIEVTVDIISIRLFDESDFRNNPDFFVKVLINSEEFSSPIWDDSPYLYDIHWTVTANVPDDIEQVDITIELYDKTMPEERFCVGSKEPQTKTQGHTAHMIYNLKTGHWTGDDYVGDPSGYGRLNSCDVKNIYQPERDCEIWFNINQTDYDKDGIPYWTEVYTYGTDPKHDNTGEDLDGDILPIEWEHKWMYNPNMWDNHAQVDMDNDSLTNVEEYHMSSWDSDPYRRDIYIEMDVMAEGPLGQNCSVPTSSKELLRTAYNRRNIVLHLDDGCMGGGGEIIPFDRKTYPHEILTIYNTYFLHNDSENWRRSVFRYAMIIYNHYTAAGMAFVGEHPRFYWHIQGINTFVISAQSMQKTSRKLCKQIDFVFACAIMHETGHTFGIDFMFPAGCDNIGTSRPSSLAFWLFGNYKSCMNYRYVYSILDYSDGSHGLFDYDDWSNLNLLFFEKKDR
jgi:hypothetical protein